MPEYECREAAVYTGITWQQYGELLVEEQAVVVAQHRMSLMIKAHVEDASSSKHDQDSRRAAARSRTRPSSGPE